MLLSYATAAPSRPLPPPPPRRLGFARIGGLIFGACAGVVLLRDGIQSWKNYELYKAKNRRVPVWNGVGERVMAKLRGSSLATSHFGGEYSMTGKLSMLDQKSDIEFFTVKSHHDGNSRFHLFLYSGSLLFNVPLETPETDKLNMQVSCYTDNGVWVLDGCAVAGDGEQRNQKIELTV